MNSLSFGLKDNLFTPVGSDVSFAFALFERSLKLPSTGASMVFCFRCAQQNKYIHVPYYVTQKLFSY